MQSPNRISRPQRSDANLQALGSVPKVSWDDFLAYWRTAWRQGQHVTIIAPTDSGKSTLATKLVENRGHVVVFGTKHRDDTLNDLAKKYGWKRVYDWKDRGRSNRVVLWPAVNDIDKLPVVHREAFTKAIKEIYKIGGWCIWWDEVRYMSDHLGMKKLLTLMYTQARSNDISLVGSAQRPANIPLEAYSQAGHLFLFKTGDERDLERIGSLNGADAKQIAAIVSRLPFRTFLHVNLNDSSMRISKLVL